MLLVFSLDFPSIGQLIIPQLEMHFCVYLHEMLCNDHVTERLLPWAMKKEHSQQSPSACRDSDVFFPKPFTVGVL